MTTITLSASSNVSTYTIGTPIIYTVVIGNPITNSSALTINSASFVTNGGASTTAQPVVGVVIPLGGTYTTFVTRVATGTGSEAKFVTLSASVTGSTTAGPGIANLSTPLMLITTTGLAITKLASVSKVISGVPFIYSFLVQNISATAVPQTVSVTDVVNGITALPPTSNGATSVLVPAGGIVTFNSSGIAVVDTSDVATLTPSGATSNLALPLIPLPATSALAVSFNKSTTSTFSAAGQTIMYTYTITNTGLNAITNITVTDIVPPPTAPIVATFSGSLAVGNSTMLTGSYVTTSADVAAGFVSNFARVVAQSPAITGLTAATPALAGMGITVPLVAVCIHGSSEVWKMIEDNDVESKVLCPIENIKAGDYVLAADGEPARVMEVCRCWDKHPLSSSSHKCIVFPVDSIMPGVPTKTLIIDPGHPIATPESFRVDALTSLLPASWYLDRPSAEAKACKTDWHDADPKAIGPVIRYDLILEAGSCEAYIANGVVIRSRGSVESPEYWHDADE